MHRAAVIRVGAVLAASALVVTACGEAPEETDAGSDGTDFVGCMVTDEGGVDDKSFNETSHRGLVNAHDAGTISEVQVAESHSTADFEPNVSSMVSQDCGLIVTVGFMLADATAAAAESNPDERFAIVDFQYTDEDSGEPVTIDNVKPLVFNTHEASFLAGYLAAGYSETGTVATWGGAKIPTVTIFMDGYYDGVQHYNEVHDADVEVLGWDKESQDGQFTDDFSNASLAQQYSENLIQQGADVIMPVAGPIGESAAVAARDAGDVALIWVDTDGYESLPEYSDLILTSVVKGMDTAVQEAVEATADGEFSPEPFVGTLDNEGVSIAPYHDFSDEIDEELADEVAELEQQIIDGDLEVQSDAAF
ncbi:BMP family ABC transporter substrate-binding protein [Haloechinothrix sp. YIM 98757]|uniref:BMP family ABC transporter substrate-binding protein n=1 Tax=Haloechinothrix aidingensis TaxID=2752311 RepID=A0A838AFJ3_9PSEU|nr:BMP family ABC transporter substrate-binding protein [Haloechinothrix aidingensis]MBA0128106.1 BMP family ABC transporter substrate-binding protein [Haloechinothrix aidingensis]